MAKIKAKDIFGMGFTPEMYKKNEPDFREMVDLVIQEQSALLESRVGAAKYASSDAGIAGAVKRAEKCLAAAEMIQSRIVNIIGNAVPNGEEPDTTSLDRQKKKYVDEADGLIGRIIGGSVGDAESFSSGVTISSGTGRSDFLYLYT